jgi:hypothetical protein
VSGARGSAARVRPSAPRPDRPVAALLLLVVVLVGACGAATVAPSGAPTPSGTSASSGGSSQDGSGRQPSPTWWPAGVVESIIGLGKADQQILNAGADLGAAAAYEDLPAMRGAADGLADLLKRLETLVDRIRDYPETAPLAASYDQSLPVMIAGATKMRDSIDAGDAAGLEAGSQQLAKGLELYAETRRILGPLVDQAILMQRLLVQ